MIVASIKLDAIKLNKLKGDIPARANKILDRAAVQIQARAIRNTRRVDTGAMKNGWRIDTPSEFKRRIYNTQHYAIYNEMGTSTMSASPMLVPAIETYRQKLTNSWAKLFAEDQGGGEAE